MVFITAEVLLKKLKAILKTVQPKNKLKNIEYMVQNSLHTFMHVKML